MKAVASACTDGNTRRGLNIMSSSSTNDWWTELFLAIDAKDAAAFVSFLTDDAEFRFGSGPSVYGKEAIETAVSQFFKAINASRHQLTRTWEDHQTRVCQGAVTYTRLDQTQVTIPFANILEMRDEKVRRYLIYVDIAPLFAQSSSS